MFAYLVAAWFISGDATPTRAGGVGTSTKIWAWAFQIVSPILLIWCFAYAIRRSRRDGRVHFDLLLLIGATVCIWVDPMTTNFFRTQMLYNSYLVNLGSWAEHIPGWLSPNAHLFPEPLINWGALYAVTYLGAAVVGCWGMRMAQSRRPNMGHVGLVFWGFATIAVFDLVLEVFFIRTELYAYAGAIRELSVWGGHRYQFPIYESILFGGCWTCCAALRFFRDDRGRSVVERGTDKLGLSPAKETGLRLLAVTGFMTVTYVIYSFIFSATTLWGDPFPEGYPRYMTNGLCGPETQYQCVPPEIPRNP
jgi:hypothetical protein